MVAETKAPLVSVVTPCYNASRFLREAIQSILDQTYQNLELIVVDDGSTDDTADVVTTYTDPRLRYIRQDNHGPASARNTGVAASKGDYIAFLDSDDKSLPHRVAAQLAILLSDPTLSAVASGFTWIDEQGSGIPWSYHSWQKLPDLNDLRYWLFDCPVVPSAMMIRRKAWEDVGGFDEELIGPEDWNFWMRVVLTGHRMVWHQDVVCLYRHRRDSLSQNAEHMPANSPEALRRVLNRPDFPPRLVAVGNKALALRYVDGAKVLYRSRQWEEARGYLEQAVVLDPSLLEGRPCRVEDEVVSAAIDPIVNDPIPILRTTLDNLPSNVQCVVGDRQQLLTRAHVELLVRGFQQRNGRLVYKHLLPVLLAQPSFLLKPGMRAVVVRALKNRLGFGKGRAQSGGNGPGGHQADTQGQIPSQEGQAALVTETPAPERDSLTRLAGKALAEMGLLPTRSRWLEPIAVAIHDLVAPQLRRKLAAVKGCHSFPICGDSASIESQAVRSPRRAKQVIAGAKPYSYEMALSFPLMPVHHRTAWRYMFDWAITGEALRCAPGDLVLEFGAGPCWASELLNRLGYRTVSLDINPEILTFARDRLTLDKRLKSSRSSFIVGDGQHLPFADATFDGVICLNALHHMPDYTTTLSEIRRVLKPAGRAVFSEPGSLHADAPESKFAAEQFGEVEKSIVLDDIYRIARQVGFDRMILKPYVYPHMVDLDYRQFGLYRHNRSLSRYTSPGEIARAMEEGHPIFVLALPGERPPSSASPDVLRAELALSELPAIVCPGQKIAIHAAVQNIGNTLWLSTPLDFGGHVTFGMKLCLPDGQILLDGLGRTQLPRDVFPGERVEVHASLELPESLALGTYLLRFDMVDEQITWFEQTGSKAVEHRFVLAARPAEVIHKQERATKCNDK